jgi:hypothetical protein
VSEDIFIRTKKLLQAHVRKLEENNIEDENREEAEDIIDELDLLIKNKAFIEHLEEEIEEEERKMVSDGLAQEILNGKYCVGGNCED